MRRSIRVLVVCLVAWFAGPSRVAAQSNQAPLTNADVVRMISAGMSDGLVVRAIRTSAATRFDTSADALIALRAQKIPETVIAAMLDKQAPARTGAPGRTIVQPDPRKKWEVEVHGGGAFGSSPSDGTGGLPPAGPTFLTTGLNASRRVSSWYFGDGAALLNAVNTAFGSTLISGRITPLDAVLKQQGTTWRNGGSFGVRVGYGMTPRFTAEFTLDAPLGQLKTTDALLAGVEASRASFITAWNDQTGFLRSGGGIVFTNPAVTSVAAIDDRRGRQLFTTGGLTINFSTSSRFVPYATVGAGVVSNTGGAPSVTLTGNYRFTSWNFGAPITIVGGVPVIPTFPVNETDNVTIRLVPSKAHSFAGVFGGGVKLLGSPRWGVRADVRAYVSSNTVDVLVDANPQVAIGTPAGYIFPNLTPSLQLSTLPAQITSLSGAPISEFKTFTSSGMPVQVSVSLGYFVRF
jgi:hypothetical protein